ncbi:MAG: CHAT domain-containing tetratricopeptide repeat protein [Byssovorax sp.]
MTRRWAIALAAAVALATAAPAAADPRRSLAQQLDEATAELSQMEDLFARRRYDEGRKIGEATLALRQKLLPADAWEIADACLRLGKGDMRFGHYPEAEAHMLRALAIGEKKYAGGRDLFIVPVLGELGALYEKMARYDRAEAMYRREIAVRQADSQGPAMTWSARRGLARIDLALGRMARAEPVLEEAVSYFADYRASIYRVIIAESLAGLGTILRVRGEYPRAEAALQRALGMSEKDGDAEGLAVAARAEDLGALYLAKHDLGASAQLFERALRLRREGLDPRHPDVARTLALLAAVHREAGDLAKADAALAEALSIVDERLDPEHPARASIVHEAGLAAIERGDLAVAEARLGEALAARKKRLGEAHLDVAATLEGLARVAEQRRDLAGAGALLGQALAVREAALGGDHPEVATLLGDLGRLALREGQLERARDLVGRALAIQDRRAPLILAMGTEEQKLSYLRSTAREADLALSIHAAMPGDAAAAELALATVFRRKGRVLDAMADSFEALRARSDPTDRKLLGELAQVDEKLSALLLLGPRWQEVTKNREEIGELSLARRQIEAEVSKRAGELRDRDGAVTLDRVEKAIPAGAALVELSIHRPFLPEREGAASFGPPRVAAFVLRRGEKIQRVDLGEVAALDALVAALRQALASPDRDPRPAARALDAAVMDRLAPLLGGARWIFLCPDGALNLVPFGALVDAGGRYRIETTSFTYLTSGADLLRSGVKRASREPPLVVASPDFGDRHGRRSARADSRGLALDVDEQAIDPGALRFPPLAETAVEGKLIQYFFPGTRILVGKDATEAALKKVHGPKVLHLATHGFFLPPPGAEASEKASARPVPLADPLLRSGLALALANERESEGGQDGILTAREVATGLDLSGTKLVVLSACETGIGDVREGDGVHGLRRALVLAGAETMVMSLWKVDDLSTRNLMVGYYRRLVAGGGRSEALRQVALDVLAEPAHAHPYFWASFIVSGDGAALDGHEVAPSFARVAPGPRGCACEVGGAPGEPDRGALALFFGLVSLAVVRRTRS